MAMYILANNPLDDRAGCFTLIVFLLSCGSKYSASLLRGALVALLYVTVAFSGYTPFLLFAETIDINCMYMVQGRQIQCRDHVLG